MGKQNQQTGYLSYDGTTERIDFEALGSFDKVREWKKDAWTSERGFGSNVIEYLDCMRLLHSE
jgi:hypothetical protein